jgi:predicted RNA-binding Zn-ribbon protein involved in translation (DUF1610 family)
MEKFMCPKCGKTAMVKKETENGTYKLICNECGFEHQLLPPDTELSGFV